MADAALLISVTSLIISSATALIGIIISWINHQREYDPMIALGIFRSNEDSQERVVRIKNLGRGTAFDVRVTIFDEQKKEYRANSIDLIPSNEYENIPFEFWSYLEIIDFSIMELTNKNESLLYHLTYKNENGRKQTYYFGELIPHWYTKITQREFRKFRKFRNKKELT